MRSTCLGAALPLVTALVLSLLATGCSRGRSGGGGMGPRDGGGGGRDVGGGTGEVCARDSDCDDDDPCTVFETCDPTSATCFVSTLDGDGDGDPPAVCGGGDCNDDDPSVSSVNRESCDGFDE